jgi:flavin reductase (DIM6/NTAB) family NADH-FMN oxidoreductase RutF
MSETLSDTSVEQHEERGDIAGVLEEMPYGTYIIGSVRGGHANAMIADWVMQVSFVPHLIAISFENDSHSLASIRENNALTVNMLPQSDEGMELAGHFVQPYEGQKIKGRSAQAAGRSFEKLEGVEHRTTPTGCPILGGAIAWMICEAQQFVDAGDHTLVVAHVVDAAVEASGEPLTSGYTGWVYAG